MTYRQNGQAARGLLISTFLAGELTCDPTDEHPSSFLFSRSMTLNTRFGKIRPSSVRLFVFGTIYIILSSVFSGSAILAEETRPNVILIVADDVGWADLGCYGSKFYRTPNLDRLASSGMRFTQAYAAAPVGSPTRAAMMTGRYPQRFGITTSVLGTADDPSHRLKTPQVPPELPLAEITIAEVLKGAGYRTGSIGKWNLGGAGHSPTEQGFDVSIAGIDVVDAASSVIAPYVNNAGKPLPGLEDAPAGEYLTDRLAAEATKFIKENKTRPFFLYLPQFAVHMPALPKPGVAEKYGKMPTTPNGSQNNPDTAAMIETMDEGIGQIVKTLDELDLSKNTIILFTSDNGGVCNNHGQIVPPTINNPLRDGMGHLYEGGLRVPLLVKWPKTVKEGATNEDVVSCLDFFTTIAEACGIAQPDLSKIPPIDGISLLTTLKGTGHATREALFWHFPHYGSNAGSIPGAAIRAGDWKLVEFYQTGRRELFNLKEGEGNNYVEQQASIANDLAKKLDEWRAAVGAKPPVENPGYTPNLQSDDGSVVMHSSSADVYGLMLRYEPFPHKDTLGYWVREQDWASFEFTLKRPGRFHLVPHVGCGTSGGSLVHFELADQTLPLTVPGTGHFQNFVPQDLGIVTLDHPGRYTLKVKPQKKEGVAVMDIRRIELKPVTADGDGMLADLHLMEPFWRSKTIYRESVLFVQDADGQPAVGKLLFPANKILALHSADGTRQFKEGTDFELSSDGKELLRKDASRMAFLKATDLFMPKGARPVWKGGAQPAVPCALPHKAGDPETHVLFDNGHWFHDQQVEVTYVRADANWPGPVPQFDAGRLPKTLARLRAKQKLTIGVSGDSITYGLNASGLVMASPYMPMYPDLVASQLRAHYGCEVHLFNRAVGGWAVPNGLSDLDKLLAHEPDLFIIAYGMNDVGRRNPDAYKSGIQEMLTRIRAARPDSEVILVATMLGNDQWTHTPREMFPKYREVLASLCGDGVALADLTSLWTEMLKRKRDCDLTGNGVNHPSDFGHRVYASAVLSLLIGE